jgi:signal transduction histidine kinase
LEGFDREWIDAGARRTAYYTNIPPGRYVFRAKAANSDGIWNEEGTAFVFKLQPHFYQTAWFYLLCLSLFSASIWTIHRYRLGRALELERIRSRIASDLHDDIGSGLSRIAVLADVLSRHVLEKEPHEKISRIASSSRDLIDSMSDIVWAVNPARDQFSDLINRMRRFANDVLSEQDIDLRFQTSNIPAERQLGADLRRQIYLIFKESVNNVARHSNCTAANISFLIEGNRLIIEVADNGRGFEPGGQRTGHGLKSIGQRAESIRGIVKVQTAPGKGTTVRIEVPWKRKLRFPPEKVGSHIEQKD